ncbi:NAD(P)/FAD-dependent oxidoreductase [Mycobacterium vicinigordonae]|uniref:NAD(P)/FAD-dependent oxidoreductase n=2 Tax=Mycobacterium vicinigordonae TaxID=1719132 RepID=A0A7D6IRB5_9MYCO|nr:NAD(P)/FAD-dependent oxidoreductase [Mycobacterium vicinigordonae]
MTHRLRNVLGIDVRVFEAGETVGGTWFWNRYPGARCDSESYTYCFSFSDELLEEWDWTCKYPEQKQLLAYLEHVADRFDLRRSIEFDTRVLSAEFVDETGLWRVTTNRDEHVHARFLVSAIGALSIAPYTPHFHGIESFQGKWYHTADWPHEPVDFSGKRVGVIGTGSSGVQTIPVVAEQAEHVTVFQRTAQYSIPANHDTFTEDMWRDIKSHYRELWDKAQQSAGGFPWEHNGKGALEVDDQERQATYEKMWREGGMKFALGSFKDISYDPAANETASNFIKRKIREAVRDPETAEALIPDHPFWARRPIVDTNYYQTYNRNNVALVDLKKTPIIEVTPDGVRTSTGVVPLEILIFATGFDAITGPFFNIDLRGYHGLTIRDKWAHGGSTYLGLMTSGFPNFFMVGGPGSTTGNVPLTLETHGDWIADCIDYMRCNGINLIEASAEAENEWTDYVQERAQNSMLAHANSWINGANIPGKTRFYNFYLGHFGRYRKQLQDIAQQGYPGFEMDRVPVRKKTPAPGSDAATRPGHGSFERLTATHLA